jgi:hypothetical protein
MRQGCRRLKRTARPTTDEDGSDDALAGKGGPAAQRTDKADVPSRDDMEDHLVARHEHGPEVLDLLPVPAQLVSEPLRTLDRGGQFLSRRRRGVRLDQECRKTGRITRVHDTRLGASRPPRIRDFPTSG